MRALSPRQREVLEFLRDFASSHGMAPSIREVARHFGVAPATAAGHLRALQRKHLVTRSDRARSIVLVSGDPAEAVMKIPLYGRLISPDLADSRHLMEGIVLLHRMAAGRRRPDGFFALQMRDESMRGLGIFRGDVAVFAPVGDDGPRLGDVAAVFIDGGELVRGIFPGGRPGVSILRAAHPDIPDREVEDSALHLLGVLVALQREYPR